MSIESARTFIERLKSDEDFLARVSSCKNPEERMNLTRSEGFEFTVAEINKVKEEFTSDDLMGTIFKENRNSFDSILGHGCETPPPA